MIFQTCCTYNRFFPLNCVYYKTYSGLSAKKVCLHNLSHTPFGSQTATMDLHNTNRNYGFTQHKP